MARPQKQTVDYFPHEAIASDGITLTILQSKFGNDGYAFWFKLLERLCSSKGHYIDCRNTARWQFLLAKTNVSKETGTAILNLLAELEAIDSALWAENVIWSQNLVNNIAIVYKNRRTSLPLKPNSNDQKPLTSMITTQDNPHPSDIPTDNNQQSIVYYSKEDNKGKKLKNTNLSTPLGNNTSEVFKQIDKIRGYKPPKRKAEAASIIRMLVNYTPDQIVRTWQTLKKDKFWEAKELYMMSVESQIGALVNVGTIQVKHQPDVKVIQ